MILLYIVYYGYRQEKWGKYLILFDAAMMM